MSSIGSVASPPPAAAVSTNEKTQSTQKAEGKAADARVASSAKGAQSANQDPSRGQSVDVLA